MKTHLECAGVVLEGRPAGLVVIQQHDGAELTTSQQHLMSWTVDGEPMKDAEFAVEIWMARIYGSTLPVPAAITKHIRVFAGLQLAAPDVMVRRAMTHADIKVPELAKRSGISQRSIRRILNGKQDPTAATLFALTHAGYAK